MKPGKKSSKKNKQQAGRLKITAPFEEALKTAFSPKIQKTDRTAGSK